MEGGETGGHVHAGANARGTEEVFGEGGDVIDEAIEGVGLGIDGPNDFVHGAGHLAGGVGDALEVGDRLVGRLATGEFAEQSDLGQTSAKIVVDVLGDAGAVAFNSVLLFEHGEGAQVLAGRPGTHQTGNAAHECSADKCQEPPRFINMGKDSNRQHGRLIVPKAFVVARGYLKLVMAGPEETILGVAPRASLDPVFVQAVQFVAEANSIRRDEAQTGITKLHLPFARGDFKCGVEARRAWRLGHSINEHVFDEHGRRQDIGGLTFGMDGHDALKSCKKQASILTAPGGGLVAA